MARTQLVMEIEKNNGFGFFDDIQETTYLPFCWMEEGVDVIDEVSTRTTTIIFIRISINGWC